MKANLPLCVGLVLVCVGPAFSQGPLKSPYYPLEIGNRWTYRAIDLKSPQLKVDPKRKVVIEVERQETYTARLKNNDGTPKVDAKGAQVTKDYVGYILKSTSGDKTQRDHVVIMDDGVYRVHVAGTQLTPPQLFFKLGKDIKNGETWPSDSVSGNTTVKGTFTATQDAVEVPFGKSNSWHIAFHNNKLDDERNECDYWFVHEVGMVKQRVRSNRHEIVLELERFDKAK